MFNIKQTGSLSTDNHIGSKNNFSHFEEELIRKSNKPKHEAKARFTNFTWFYILWSELRFINQGKVYLQICHFCSFFPYFAMLGIARLSDIVLCPSKLSNFLFETLFHQDARIGPELTV